MDSEATRLCGTCGEPNPVRAKFCMECATKLEAPDSLGERRILTVLFADLSGFTAFSEGSDVEDVQTLAQEAADRLSEIVDRYGGTVDKIIGDCVMAVWGAPVTHEDDAERAVRAALDMQGVVASKSEKFFGLALCVGLYTGEAIWAPIGPDGRYTALGDTVNTAARLQGAAGKGEVLVGSDTYEASAEAIDYEAVEPIKAKNKAEPVPAWKAIGVKGVRRRAVELPMVGRQAEMHRLWELWELVRTERVPYLAAVTGGPGIGKSRLVRAITGRLEESADVLVGRCLDYGEGITYWPVTEMVKGAAGIRHDDSLQETSRKLGVLLEALGSEDLDELRTMAVAMANLVAAPTTPRGTYSATEITRGELHWGIRRVFQLLAKRRPVTLVFEDLHWAEPALVDLVTSFIELTDDAPILVIGSARPELDPKVFEGRRNTRRIEVDALNEEDSRALVAHMLGTEEAADGPVAKLLESAAGNPLFLEEMVRMLANAGALDDDGRLIPDKVAALSMPSSVRALIGTRLDNSLSGAQKRTAGRASVVGEAFWSGAVAYIDNASTVDADVYEAEIDRMLGELEDKDVVLARETSTITGQHEWNFRHALIRDVVYQRIPKNQRVALHARAGQWMAALPGGADELIEIVAHHLEQACLIAAAMARSSFSAPILDAVQALTRAAEKAYAREGTAEAGRFYTRAIDLLGDSYPETATDLRFRRARIMTGFGNYAGAYEELSVVAEQSVVIGRLDLRCRALITLAEIDVVMGRVSDARAHVEDAERLAQELNDAELQIRVASPRATIHEQFEASPTAAEDDLRGALALAEEIDNPDLMLTAYTRLGALLYNAGKLAEAQLELERCVTIATERGSLRHLSWVTAMLGLVRSHCGSAEQASAELAQASEWLERTGEVFMNTQVLMWHANLELAVGRVKDAIKLLRQAMLLARQSGGWLTAQVCRSLVDALVREGRAGEARKVAATAKEQAPDEDPTAQASAMIAEATVAAAEGNDEEARERLAVALPLLKEQDAPMDLGEALLFESRVLVEMGDGPAAAERLQQARTIFDAVGAGATVERIDDELERVKTLRKADRGGRLKRVAGGS